MVPVFHHHFDASFIGKGISKVPLTISWQSGEIMMEDTDCYMILGRKLTGRPYWVGCCYNVTGEVEINVSIAREFKFNSCSGRFQIKYNPDFTREVNEILNDRE